MPSPFTSRRLVILPKAVSTFGFGTMSPWASTRDFDVFVITIRLEHQIEGKREYKTRKEIEDLSEVVFEGKAAGIKVEKV